MRTTCALVGGNAKRVARLNQSKDCLGCDERVYCCVCGRQSCYQGLGGNCVNVGNSGTPLCQGHQSNQFIKEAADIIRSL